jgi:recyclin-1
MLGHVYVVEDARDVAQIVRDVTRYGGAYRPEVSRFLPCRYNRIASDGNLEIGHIRIHPEAFGLEKD